jgi:uncharacterized phage protein (TIGR02218 family)
MSRVWFSSELESVATYWRLMRADGVTLGFTTHDANLWFDGVMHLTTPGMVPSAIRRSASFDADSAEVQGAITHDAINANDLVSGRYDSAVVVIGLVDWESLEHQPIYSGSIGAVTEQDIGFTAELQSRKADLQIDPIPRTSPCCRAEFCGQGCGLSAQGFIHEAVVSAQDLAGNAVTLTCAATPTQLVGGSLRWLDGPYAGMAMGIAAAEGSAVVLDSPVDLAVAVGARTLAREGCDWTIATCASRFANAVNFQGEPFLPGNDLIMRYGLAQ